MLEFSLVVAADQARGIGRDGQLPWPSLKKDMKYFREVTTGDGNSAVIMGRRTWESIPVTFRPLPKRRNIVITSRELLGAESVDSLDAALALADTNAVRFVIGGGQVYRTALNDPRLVAIYYTRICATFACDTFFPAFEEAFDCVAVSPLQHEHDIEFQFETWRRRS